MHIYTQIYMYTYIYIYTHAHTHFCTGVAKAISNIGERVLRRYRSMSRP